MIVSQPQSKYYETRKRYREANRQRIAAQRLGYMRQYRAENRATLLANRRLDYTLRQPVHAQRRAEYKRRRRQIDPGFRVLQSLRLRAYHALRRSGGSKSACTIELVGCTPDQLRQHLESQFQAGMTWSNYGLWHVDHKRPCASFDLSTAAQQRACFHYTNLQPLWAIDNLRKGDSVL